MSMSQLCKEQHNDPEILPLLERAFDEKEIDRPSPNDVSAEDEWTVNHQIVFRGFITLKF